MSEVLGDQLEEAIRNCQAISQECRDSIASREQLMETRFQHWKRRLAGLVSPQTLNAEWEQKTEELMAENALLKQRLVDVGRVFGVSTSSVEAVGYPGIIQKKHQSQVDAARKELQEKSNKAIDDLQSAITDLKTNFRTICKENESLKSQIAEAKTQVANATAAAEAAAKASKSATKADDVALNDTKKKLAISEAAKAAADSTIKHLEEQLEESKKLISNMATATNAVRAVKIAMNGLDALKVSYNKSITAYSALKRSWPDATKGMEGVKASLKELTDDHNAATQQIQGINRLVSDNKTKVDNLIEQAKPAVAAFQEAAQKQEEELRYLREKNSQLELQNASLQKMVADQKTKKHDKTRYEYQHNFHNNGQNQPSDADLVLPTLENAVWELRNELSKEHQSKMFYMRLCENHEDKMKTLEGDIRSLKKELAMSMNTRKQLQQANEFVLFRQNGA
ncbi:hypothetical protein BX666DRAFT_665509 [Dichotomocladium elegans]|nr:hypothetical protein BX666DRAFT_665509 [Dichotomocladium elegans]